MNVAKTMARFLPRGLRATGRDWFETQFRGTPQAMLQFRPFELSVDLDMIVSHYRIDHPEVCCLQVGAFDGVTGDLIYPLIKRHALYGIMVEPQKDAFERLRENYARFPHFQFVNAAISNHDGSATLFRIKPGARGPEWLHQIASFDRRTLMWHARMVPNLESMIETEEVRCVTFHTLLKERNINKVDLLQIDAEGLDAELLQLFDVPARMPAIVRFEHKHLSLADHEKSIRLLVGLGYRVFASCGDTLAYLMTAK